MDNRTKGQKYADSLKDLAQFKSDLKKKPKGLNVPFTDNHQQIPYDFSSPTATDFGIAAAVMIAVSFPVTAAVVITTGLTAAIGHDIHTHNNRKKQAANRKSWDLVGKFTDWRDGY